MNQDSKSKIINKTSPSSFLMNEKIKEDIKDILFQAVGFLDAKDSRALNELSNHTIHNASVFQDKDSVTIAVVVFALSKITDRMSIIEPDVMKCMKSAIASLDKDDFQEYENKLKDLVDIISGVDKKMNLYMQHIIDEAGIKKGSRLYEHGISIAQVADIFNITQWELMKYLGQTNIPEEFADEVKIEARIRKARELFGIG
jgi:hypothetical protein